MTTRVLDKLKGEFARDNEAAPLFPQREGFAKELASYRDEVLRKHLLVQVEVLALPTSAQAIPLDRASGEELTERLGEHWASCREARDKFFRSVEMVLLDGARERIRLDTELIRDRLVAAQYRNGYRLLDERFRKVYGEIARLQMSTEPEAEPQSRAELDRKVVDEIIVPLAYFIRERAEPEPRDALSSRAELFREIVDKLVATPEPLTHTAEAIKPLLRKSVEQARPLVLKDHSYLHTIVESLKPAAIHRTTALLKVFETLVQSDLDEKSLATIEQVIRLNRAQSRLLQQLESNYPELVPRLSPLDRVDDKDAAILTETIEQAAPPTALVHDLFLKLGYLDWPATLPVDSRELLRLLAVLVLTPHELTAWFSLYQGGEVSRGDRAQLARELVDRLGPGSIGPDERQTRLEAVPLPVDVNTALMSMGYRPDDKERLSSFKEEVQNAITDGDAAELAKSIRGIRQLKTAVENERVELGATGNDGDPYRVEIWLTSEGTMVGLVLCHTSGFGMAPVEVVRRDPNGGNRKETEETLRRQLQNQALIYQSFLKLFSRDVLLEKSKRRSLPSFVKKLYEPTEASRHLLLSRLRYARELLALLTSFATLIAEADAESASDTKAVLQILSGLDRKVAELAQKTEKSRDSAQRGIDWDQDVERFEAHGIRGTLGCRALMHLSDGSSKVVVLNYHRRHQSWQVRYLGPRVTDVVREALRQKGRSLPDDCDEKHEQATFSLDEQSCRFFLMKREVARIEATFVLDSDQKENLWNIVYLKYNDDVLTDRTA